MRTLAFWIGVFGFVFTGQILEGGHVGSVMQGTAAFIVFGPVISYAFYQFGFKGTFGFLKRTLTEQLSDDDSRAISAISLVGYSGGAFAAILGLIHVMENLADASKLGAGIAVAFVGCFYGLIPALMFAPLTRRKKQSGTGLKSEAGTANIGAMYSAFVVLTLLFCFFVVLYAASIHT